MVFLMKPRKWITIIGVVVALHLLLWEESPVPAPEFSYYQKDPSAMRLVEVMAGRPNHERRDVVM
jgi:hypothetical protein